MTIDQEEVEKFSKLADKWWDEQGPFRPLHELNPCRIEYIKRTIIDFFDKDISGLNMLDVGSGGGLITEPFARMGANISGIDASIENINAARLHAKNVGLDIEYIHGEATSDILQGRKFDVVLALEIIEHVSDIELFVHNLTDLIHKDGLIIISTMNRTLKSYGMAIIGAEYIMQWLPRGTHDWNKFLKPSEIAELFRKNNCNVHRVDGMSYSLLKNKWYISNDTRVNYFISASF